LKRGWDRHTGSQFNLGQNKFKSGDTIRWPALPLRGEQPARESGGSKGELKMKLETSVTATDSVGRATSNLSAPLVNGAAASSGEKTVHYVPSGSGKSYRSPIDEVTFLITGEQTGGAFFMAAVSVVPGGGNPPHIHHREEECFYLQEGTLTVQVDGKTQTASAGDFIRLPRGIAHSFENTGNVDAKFLLLVAPAGLETFFEEAFYPVEDRSAAMPAMTGEFMARLIGAASKVGLEFLPPAKQ
jgi:quercetin dioxygenase-like cupin family protein